MAEDKTVHFQSSPPKVEIKCGKKSTDKAARCRMRLFERASGNLFNLQFDTKILEKFYHEVSQSENKQRFQHAVIYIMICAAAWAIYFGIAGMDYANESDRSKRWCYVGGAIITFVLAGLFFILTLCNKIFLRFEFWIYLGSSILFSFATLIPFAVPTPPVSLMFNLSVVFQMIILIYVLIPVQMWQALGLSIILSVIYELVSSLHYGLGQWRFVIITIAAHAGVHLVGLVLHLMSQVRGRTTFLKRCQTARIKQAIEREKQVTREMILSLMPACIADEILESSGEALDADGKENDGGRRRSTMSRNVDDDSSSGSDDDETKQLKARESAQDALGGNDADSDASGQAGATEQAGVVTFRKFHVIQLENVSILFADIVGFTKMSSNKEAPQLVRLLNDLFGRFDRICDQVGCEKIATLGDCYYCVCGCPVEDVKHAEKCVEMGRGMCVAIQQFDEDHNEEVNMRVGVHTGMVISGIVGTRRFKFDVWSNDVTIANEMESSGEAGRVHISESTYDFVKDIYNVAEGESVPDIRKFKRLTEYFDEVTKSYEIKHVRDEAMIKTYFIESRVDGGQPVSLGSMPIMSATDIANITLLQKQNEAANMADVMNDQDEVPDKGDVEAHSSEHTPLKPSTTSATTTTAAGGASAVQRPSQGDMELIESLRSQKAQDEKNGDSLTAAGDHINRATMNFVDNRLEEKYRRLGLRAPKKTRSLFTFATPRITPLINVSVNFLFFLLSILTCFLAYCTLETGITDSLESQALYAATTPRWIFGVALAIALLVNICLLILLLTDVILWEKSPKAIKELYISVFNWYPRNIIGAILLATPSIIVLANFSGCLFANNEFVAYRLSTCTLILFMIYNFTLFTMYSSWTKSAMACLMVIISLILLLGSGRAFYTETCESFVTFNSTNHFTYAKYYSFNVNYNNNPLAMEHSWISGLPNVALDMILCLILTLLLIWFLNREFDISYRQSFKCDYNALKEKLQVSNQKKVADWLLGNIIPTYIMDEVNRTKAYSKHVYQAGVVFASIANFSDFYDEQFQGGKEMLRVLNEIFADLENLLTLPKYKDVEKIKTIGACFMAASGLNEAERVRNKRPDAHLNALIDFAFDLLKTMDQFNEQIFNFNFELKIGYNIGEVTAGVIGTTKLLYDIWGDTVNVASRMYSTGKKGRIQVTESVANQLSERYEFEYRGEVFVKGKGDMKTYLVVGKKPPGARQNVLLSAPSSAPAVAGEEEHAAASH